jgi:hypothetical protein
MPEREKRSRVMFGDGVSYRQQPLLLQCTRLLFRFFLTLETFRW